MGNLFSIHLQQLKGHRSHTTVSKLGSSSSVAIKTFANNCDLTHILCQKRKTESEENKGIKQQAGEQPWKEGCAAAQHWALLLGVNKSRTLQVLHSYRKTNKQTDFINGWATGKTTLARENNLMPNRTTFTPSSSSHFCRYKWETTLN